MNVINMELVKNGIGIIIAFMRYVKNTRDFSHGMN